MPREILEFRVVVASPSEMYEMRKAVFNIIDELNRTLEAQHVTIKGLGWEEYVTPGIGSDAQDVINQQLLIEYDILIALFGTRLGSPTSNAESGTVEEISHAIANTKSPLGSNRVQVYFRDKIDSTSDISIEELGRVIAYRDRLRSLGVLYRLFKNDDDLQREIRVNLQRPILDYLRKLGQPAQSSLKADELQIGQAPDTDKAANASTAEEAGFLDLQETTEESLQSFTLSINQMTSLIGEIGNETTRQVSMIQEANFLNAPAKEKKHSINQFATFLKSKAIDLKKHAQLARQNFNVFSEAIVLMANLERDQSNETYKEGLSVLLVAVEDMLNITTVSRASTATYKDSVENIPRITIQFNQAKRMLLDALSDCLELFDLVERKIFEITANT